MIALLALLACPAPEPPPDPCEVAFAELSAWRDGLQTLAGDQVRAPARDAFLEACALVPEDTRACLSVRVAHDDPTCRERLAALPTETLRRMEALLVAP